MHHTSIALLMGIAVASASPSYNYKVGEETRTARYDITRTTASKGSATL